MPSFRKLVDINDINELISALGQALDMQRWDDMDRIFLPDATITLGTTKIAGLANIIESGRIAEAPMDRIQHMITDRLLRSEVTMLSSRPTSSP